MSIITKEEYVQRALDFVEAHKDSYSPEEYEYIIKSINLEIGNAHAYNLLRQIYDKIGIHDPKSNMYESFLGLLDEHFGLERDIIEIGGGVIPSLAQKIALRQQTGTITVYDPRLITGIDNPDNLILKKEKFHQDTPVGSATMIIGFKPCEAINLLIETACRHQIDFMVALCEGGTREGYGWIEDNDEWVSYVKCCAEQGVRKANLGTLEEASLKQYGNPYPVIYNKRRKS